MRRRAIAMFAEKYVRPHKNDQIGGSCRMRMTRWEIRGRTHVDPDRVRALLFEGGGGGVPDLDGGGGGAAPESSTSAAADTSFSCCGVGEERGGGGGGGAAL
jgi:hypothetical protein